LFFLRTFFFFLRREKSQHKLPDDNKTKTTNGIGLSHPLGGATVREPTDGRGDLRVRLLSAPQFVPAVAQQQHAQKS